MEITVTLVQNDLIWENIQGNLSSIQSKLNHSVSYTDLIILPEMFTTGFSMRPAPLAEKMDGLSMQWMHKMATGFDAVLCGSLIIEEQGNFYNRLIWMPPDGNYLYYDKRHLFSLAEEDKVFTSGNKKEVFHWRGWKICPQICYDLRFPAWIRNQEGYDIFLIVANWPDKRMNAWNTLLRARAIENQAFTIGVNRIGIDGNGYHYTGGSSVIDPMGEPVTEIPDGETISTVTLKHSVLNQIREKLPFLNDRDHYEFQ